jgi:hypothetical protein
MAGVEHGPEIGDLGIKRMWRCEDRTGALRSVSTRLALDSSGGSRRGSWHDAVSSRRRHTLRPCDHIARLPLYLHLVKHKSGSATILDASRV